MAVIGRLDEQVHRVLIEPLDREGPRPTTAPAPRAGRSPAAESHRSGPSTEESAALSDEPRQREELPVWLL